MPDSKGRQALWQTEKEGGVLGEEGKPVLSGCPSSPKLFIKVWIVT